MRAGILDREHADGSLAGTGREVVLGGLDGEADVGEGLPQDDPGDLGGSDSLAGLRVEDDDVRVSVGRRHSSLCLIGCQDQRQVTAVGADDYVAIM